MTHVYGGVFFTIHVKSSDTKHLSTSKSRIKLIYRGRMKKNRGRPTSINPRSNRIETRIVNQCLHELETICSLTNINKTTAIDWALHITYLALSDSRTSESVKRSLQLKPYEKNADKYDAANSIIDCLSEVNHRFPDLDERLLLFIMYHETYETPEEMLADLVVQRYFYVCKNYTKEEIDSFFINVEIEDAEESGMEITDYNY